MARPWSWRSLGESIGIPELIRTLNTSLRALSTQFAAEDYVPVWSCQTGAAPVLGNGSLVGRYSRVGKTVTVSIRIIIGTTTTLGGGPWLFSLPLPARKTVAGAAPNLGLAGQQTAAGAVVLGAIALVLQPLFGDHVIVSIAGAPFHNYDATHPSAWVAGDQAFIALTYDADP